MSERIAASISIGGKVPRSLVPELCAALRNENLSINWGDEPLQPFTEEDLLRYVRGTWLSGEDLEANWGEFPDLENFLRDHGIGFSRETQAGVYNAEVEEYRPGWPKAETFCTDVDHKQTVLVQDIRDILDLRRGEFNTATPTTDFKRLLAETLDMLERALPPAVPTLEPFEIVDG